MNVGAHGYYHKNFQNITMVEAKHEIDLIREGMEKFNLIPKSFIFPRNLLTTSICSKSLAIGVIGRMLVVFKR